MQKTYLASEIDVIRAREPLGSLVRTLNILHHVGVEHQLDSLNSYSRPPPPSHSAESGYA